MVRDCVIAHFTDILPVKSIFKIGQYLVPPFLTRHIYIHTMYKQTLKNVDNKNRWMDK